MNRLRLYWLLYRNTMLSYRRSPAFEQNQWAKLMLYIGGGLFCIYLILYGALIGWMAEGEAGMMIAFMLLILPIDFLLRFVVQTTPDMMVKPYLLLPISRYSAIECFLISSHVSAYNLLWLAMFIPYSIIVFIGGAGWGGTLLVLLASLLLIVLNSQVYLFFRTLIRRSVLWLLPALLMYALPFTPLLFKHKASAIEPITDGLSTAATTWWFLPLTLVLIGALFLVNRWCQFRFVYEEIARSNDTTIHHVSQFSFLDRFGLVGEYLKLELKSTLRNKMMRQRTIMSLSLVVVFTLLVAYTDIYDNQLMTNFWCLYCFSIFSITSLIKVMGQEGNYIDLLMTRRETILALLKAKFWFYLSVLVVPFVLMLPAVYTGKFTLLMLVGYMLLTGGFIHFMILQLAVYNKQTIPLELKITGKGNIENGMQIVIELVALFSPVVIVGVGYLVAGPTATYVFMALLGLAFILTHPIWLRHIYKRMMRRRYDNLEGFRASRV